MKYIYIFVLILFAIICLHYYEVRWQELYDSNILTPRDEAMIRELTDKWCDEVTANHDPLAVRGLFCNDGSLVGTVSQIKRTGNDIKLYFDYFAKLPGIKIISKKYNISRVTPRVFINTAFVTWKWDGIDRPLTTRMTFVYRDQCIFQLHSSVLPERNYKLVRSEDV
jgi:hypothetical protein